MGLQRAIVLARGGPPSDATRAVIEELPASILDRTWSSIALFAPSGDAFEIDFVILGHYGLYLIQTEAYRVLSEPSGRSWTVRYPAMPDFTSQLVPSPLGEAREKARWLEQFLEQELGEALVRVAPEAAFEAATASEFEGRAPPGMRKPNRLATVRP